MNAQQDEEFTEFLRSKAREGKASVAYPATQFHRMLDGEGGYKTVNQLLAAPRVSDGYSELVMRGRPDLTVEALVTESQWRAFFDPQLLEIAETRLRRTGYAFTRFVDSGGVAPSSAPSSDIAMPERPLPLASPDAIAAVEWLKSAYGAVLTWESRKEGRQQGDSPVRIYTLPNNAQVALRMNKGAPAVYVRATSVSGADIRNQIAAITRINDVYPGGGADAPSSILHHAPYLKPSSTNVLLRLNPAPGEYKAIFELALGAPLPASTLTASPGTSSTANRRVVDEEELRRQQERNSETGKSGELAALGWERARLAALTPPCPDPESFAIRISTDDVGAGYDILSSWPGQERFIEVKTTATGAQHFFMTDNERRILGSLGERAWLYRVELAGGAGPTITTFSDPVRQFQERMTPCAWRVQLASNS